MLLICGVVGSSLSVSALTDYLHSFYVAPYGTWNIFVQTTASEKASTHYIKNLSGYGEYGYCYFKIEGKLGTDSVTTTLMSSKKINKNSSKTTCNLSNTIDKGKSCTLRVTGAQSQTGQDRAYITYSH